MKENIKEKRQERDKIKRETSKRENMEKRCGKRREHEKRNIGEEQTKQKLQRTNKTNEE